MPSLTEQIERSKRAIEAAIECIAEVDTTLRERNARTLAKIADGQYIAGHLAKAKDRIVVLIENCEEPDSK